MNCKICFAKIKKDIVTIIESFKIKHYKNNFNIIINDILSF